MSKRNGIRTWLLAVLTTIALTAASWALAKTVDHGQRLAVTEAHVMAMQQWLGRVEDKLDRALAEQQRGP